MSLSHIVLDSGAYAKLFLQEEGRDDLLELLKFIGEQKITVLCPDIFLFEVLSIAAQNSIPLKETLKHIRSFEASYLRITALSDPELELAMKMAEDGHEKSGYPSIYDSAYHVLAIANDGVFITADKRHIAKARQYGHVALIEDWRSAVSAKQ